MMSLRRMTWAFVLIWVMLPLVFLYDRYQRLKTWVSDRR